MGALILIGLLFVLVGLAILIGGAVSAVKQSREFQRDALELPAPLLIW